MQCKSLHIPCKYLPIVGSTNEIPSQPRRMGSAASRAVHPQARAQTIRSCSPPRFCSAKTLPSLQRRATRTMYSLPSCCTFQESNACRRVCVGCQRRTRRWSNDRNERKAAVGGRRRFITRNSAGGAQGDDDEEKAKRIKADRAAALRALRALDEQVDTNTKRAVPRVADGPGTRKAKPQLERELDWEEEEKERIRRQERIAQWPSSPGSATQRNSEETGTTLRFPEIRELVPLAIGLAIMTVIANFIFMTALHI